MACCELLGSSEEIHQKVNGETPKKPFDENMAFCRSDIEPNLCICLPVLSHEFADEALTKR
jgi:hypothetical protein